MKKYALLLAVLSAGLVSAQSKPTDEDINMRFQVLAAQRNGAMDQVVILQARVAVLEEQQKNCKKE